MSDFTDVPLPPPDLDYAAAMAALPGRTDKLVQLLNEKRWAAAKILATEMTADMAYVLNFIRLMERGK